VERVFAALVAKHVMCMLLYVAVVCGFPPQGAVVIVLRDKFAKRILSALRFPTVKASPLLML
jgi:glutathione peroxidase-family protein